MIWTRPTSGTRQAPGLASDFLAAVDTCLASIRRHPGAYALVDPTMRRALLRRFPYAVFYEIEPGEIVVYSVFHGARDPRVWRRRKDG